MRVQFGEVCVKSFPARAQYMYSVCAVCFNIVTLGLPYVRAKCMVHATCMVHVLSFRRDIVVFSVFCLE